MTSPPPPPKESHLEATLTTLPPPAKKESINHQVKNMHIDWGGGGGGGYIQKFPFTVLVPPQLSISSTHPTAHTHTRNIAYPLPQSNHILP